MVASLNRALPRSSPEQQGIASAALIQLIEAFESRIHELHSFMLVRHGFVVAEGWWSPYRPDQRHLVFSLSKSFTATAVGLALGEGCFSLDDPVVGFFPDAIPADANDFVTAMRVRDLLSMTTGHDDDTWWPMSHRPDGDWLRGFFELPVRHAPGTHFLYNTGASYVLSALVQKTTGQSLIDYLRPRLFEPLGIDGATWQESPQGIAAGGLGLSIRTEDIARFGQLYLQNGLWHGQRVLPDGWTETATARQTPTWDEPDSDWAQGYGYQFWRSRHGAYRGDGVFGQYCIVMPEQDAVIAMTGGVDLGAMQEPLDLIWEILLPAMGLEPLPEDSASAHLAETLASLQRLPVQGRSTSPVAAAVSGRCYRVDANALGIDTLTLRFADDGCTLTVGTATGEAVLPCGSGVWLPGQTDLFNDVWVTGVQPVVASGAWTDDDCFRMVVRLVATPFYYTLAFHFVGDDLLVEAQVNVSFDASKLLLTARAAAA